MTSSQWNHFALNKKQSTTIKMNVRINNWCKAKSNTGENKMRDLKVSSLKFPTDA